MSVLFSPFQLGGLRLENRIVVSPMCQYSATDGVANDWHLVNLGHLALGGASLAFFEATHVSPEGRITPGCLGLYGDEHEAAMRRVVEYIHRWTAAKVGVQLAHAGRKGSTFVPWEGNGSLTGPDKWQAVAPSAIPYDTWDTPAALDEAGLQKVKRDFVAAAERASRIGIDAAELHFAHGYLAHEFLSPLSNQRTDAYGGSLENRMRFPLELFAAVRAVWPKEKPLGVRISATDWVAGGWDLESSIAFSHGLKALGADFIDVSSGGLSPDQQIQIGPGYQVAFSRAIRKDVGITTMSVGMIVDPQQAEKIVADGDADLIELARGFLRDPRWAWTAADQLKGEAFVPPQYLRARKTLRP